MKKLITGTIFAMAVAGWSGVVDAKTIGVALASDTNPFYIAMLKGIQDAGRADRL